MKKFLNESKYLKNLDELDKHALLRCIKAIYKEFEPNEIIKNQYDHFDNIYIILDGLARTTRIDEDGREIILQDYKKDNCYGIEYIDNDNAIHDESLISITKTKVLICDAFRTVTLSQNKCKRHIDFIRLLFLDFSHNVKYYNNRIMSLTKSKTRDKVLDYLKQVKKENKTNSFKITLNRQQLADYLGVERSALSNELSKLKKEKLIDFNKNQFTFLK
ncbi:MAG: Crp/Fnr family transcriptional regulator [Anaeroplasmataceae bacterium]